ncbi:MAG: DUF1573 domain-containing protein [Chitinophagaceae bacterium]|nr:DUF1573 domain-containing protein [Chitinophagaceae bacterium]
MTVRSLIFLTFVSFAAACGSTDAPKDIDAIRNESSKELTTIEWIDSVRNFGNISEGQKLSVSFRFKNTGNKPLVIQSVHPACGCTVADYPKEPIAPGQEGEITGEFNSEGREGQNHKEITVRTNTAAHSHNLVFDVNVVAKPQQQAQAPAN